MDIPLHLKYTKAHEWIKIDGNAATVGITEFAQSELGDIVFVDINTLDKTLQADEVFGTIEAVKTVSDLFLPLTGKVLEINPALASNPELINKDPYQTGWIIKIAIAPTASQSHLLSAEDYKNLVH